MASTYGTAVAFTKEKNVWTLSAVVTFGATGIPTLDTNNSKGICNFAIDAVSFTANSVGSSATLSSVTSFQGLYNGMTVNGALGGPGTVSSITAGSGLITLTSGTGIVTANAGVMTATGGRFRVQFGQQAAQRLDAYVKLMTFGYSWDMSASSAAGSVSTQALAPSAADMFIAQNTISVRTIPQTSTSGSTDCSLVIQMGNAQAGAGGNFIAASPVAGSKVRFFFVFGNSTSP